MSLKTGPASSTRRPCTRVSPLTFLSRYLVCLSNSPWLQTGTLAVPGGHPISHFPLPEPRRPLTLFTLLRFEFTKCAARPRLSIMKAGRRAVFELGRIRGALNRQGEAVRKWRELGEYSWAYELEPGRPEFVPTRFPNGRWDPLSSVLPPSHGAARHGFLANY